LLLVAKDKGFDFADFLAADGCGWLKVHMLATETDFSGAAR
jgi:hypothetical protein